VDFYLGGPVGLRSVRCALALAASTLSLASLWARRVWCCGGGTLRSLSPAAVVCGSREQGSAWHSYPTTLGPRRLAAVGAWWCAELLGVGRVRHAEW
jgi:hypothetical protein